VAMLRRNFRGTDWSEWEEALESRLAVNPLPPLPLSSHADIDAYTDSLTSSIVAALEAHVPLSRPSPFTNRWWCKKLSELRAVYNR
ncbi:hypothetical protein B0H14DRAFT_2253129, partial [Mycena olivaceomarginata]